MAERRVPPPFVPEALLTSSPEYFVVVHRTEDVRVEETPTEVHVKMPLCTRIAEEIKCEPEGYFIILEKGVPGPKEVRLKYPR